MKKLKSFSINYFYMGYNHFFDAIHKNVKPIENLK